MHPFMLALVGGFAIGISAVLLLWMQNRVLGISGIVNQLTLDNATDWQWRTWLIAGVVSTPLIGLLFNGTLPSIQINTNPILLIVAGLLVGFGTRLGNGCTSGHGVCGVAKLSIRSIVATVSFVLVAMLTVAVMRHLIGIV